MKGYDFHHFCPHKDMIFTIYVHKWYDFHHFSPIKDMIFTFFPHKGYGFHHFCHHQEYMFSHKLSWLRYRFWPNFVPIKGIIFFYQFPHITAAAIIYSPSHSMQMNIQMAHNNPLKQYTFLYLCPLKRYNFTATCKGMFFFTFLRLRFGATSS